MGTALAVQGPEETGKRKVACWNRYFPFESEPPQFFQSPGKCLWYKRGAETYAEGSLLGTRLGWTWGRRRAKAEGRLKVPGVGDEFRPGRVRLTDPVKSCGREVFSRLEYRINSPEGQRRGEYPIYTCRSRPG